MRTFYMYSEKTQSITTINAHETVDTLKLFYQIIGCNIVEMVYLDHGITIVVDEEGLLKKPIDINIIKEKKTNQTMQMTGNMIFIAIDEYGRTVGLNDKQMKYIENELEIVTIPISLLE
ncbi:TPA: DUF3846 domain-containing protein [Staphylococcus aureus]|uniref:DUF3846 domain-containing protein n=1 Tax=Staphylococcus aureus TaxID=1280 RepID=UPI00139D3006|nr:DUF3846 domain-containing protein [Staphylococcus aureus]NDQ33894.1 DUF3846 domain-containing protein [Staphylococcus aureus]NDQ43208.1 DUF3846 domain-containing protein [Staphylococcus aureus]HDG8429221.1 DUF3846 domain-containing protein [Staphylococcus aureus]HDG8575366.1 DUF3846 domain-containing protein [Staphylococcus aureus]HDG8686246.1 DUF3846 domain-containing protein [Staphylococcus aureus]